MKEIHYFAALQSDSNRVGRAAKAGVPAGPSIRIPLDSLQKKYIDIRKQGCRGYD